MFARKLTPQEAYLSRRNMAVAFEGDFDFEKELERSKTEEADPHADHYGAFLDCPQDPVASLIINKYDVRFDGHTVKMGGVGGVATLPPYRRSGAIRSCMQASLRDMYDDGYAFSALYPFSQAYYRQFGFSNGMPCTLWNIPLPDLKLPDVGGRVRELFPGDDLSPLLQVYNAFYKNVNLSVLRTEYDRALTKKTAMEKGRSIFVWEDENGEPGAFLIGSRAGDVLNCRTDFSQPNGLLFRDARALRGLLGFVNRAFLANFDSIRFSSPNFVDVATLLPELNSADEQTLILNGMVRIVNVEQVLRLCSCVGSGTLTVRTEDPILPENSGAFKLSFAPGAENRVERTSDAPDVTVSVGDLSTLLCGVKTAGDLPWMPGVQVLEQNEALPRVFRSKPCHFLNLF